MASIKNMVLGAVLLWAQLIAASPTPIGGDGGLLSLLGLGSSRNGDKNASPTPAKSNVKAKSRIVPNSYIVVYKNTTSAADVKAMTASVSSQLKKRNLNKRGSEGQPLSTDVRSFQINNWHAMNFEAEESMALEVGEYDGVDYVENNTWFSTQELVMQRNAPPGLQRLSEAAPVGQQQQKGAYVYDSSAGNTTTVYVIDSGCRTTHRDLGGRATTIANFVRGESATDANGHGTHVACTIAGREFGVAKKATVKCVKVMNAQGEGTNADIIAGLQSIVDDAKRTKPQAAACNMSIGGQRSRALDAAMNNVFKANISCAQDARNVSPAAAPNAITVGAVDANTDQKAGFSNFGPSVDINAPGVDVRSCGIKSDTDESIKSGTSMASPHVAGLVAYMMTLEGISNPAEVTALLKQLSKNTDATVEGGRGGTTPLIANNGNQKDKNEFLDENGPIKGGTRGNGAASN
ncbi:Peptidase S8, subtilisin-related protein [Metarhizium guizhouense ARSEF 977]|uniref:Peptidase S8, subtilisin-related protein n=1 Tax=Metarhizium guizhouense (strain ARSEF 977) TaxID=1276136 RepID=A0A0B4GQ34_METGA|nr:Peptidase S8, subtilisin-related protein [Metarhizium guizhouense ARSEF 977]